MKTEDILNEVFSIQIKNGPELTNFLVEHHKRGIEKILEGKLDAHFDY